MRRLDATLAKAAADALNASGIGAADKELRSRMASLPPMLQVSGLPATCAFLLAKARTADTCAAAALLREAAEVLHLDPTRPPVELLDAVVSIGDERLLAVAEQHAALLATWLSRLAVARYEAATAVVEPS